MLVSVKKKAVNIIRYVDGESGPQILPYFSLIIGRCVILLNYLDMKSFSSEFEVCKFN
jgi:hypothetical protein